MRYNVEVERTVTVTATPGPGNSRRAIDWRGLGRELRKAGLVLVGGFAALWLFCEILHFVDDRYWHNDYGKAPDTFDNPFDHPPDIVTLCRNRAEMHRRFPAYFGSGKCIDLRGRDAQLANRAYTEKTTEKENRQFDRMLKNKRLSQWRDPQ